MTSKAPTIIFGTGNVGSAVDPMARINDAASAQSILDLFRQSGFTTVDTSRRYSGGAPGTSEQILGKTDIASWATVDTKVNSGPGDHTAIKIAESIDTSLQALGLSKTHIHYLHFPDRTVPYEETLRAMNDAYKTGKFEKFGISNYAIDEVETIVEICRQNGFVMPHVYQGQYSAVARKAEDKLLPLLRKHGIAFYAYSPAAGGAFSNTSSRMALQTPTGDMLRHIYGQEAIAQAIDQVNIEADKEDLTGHEVALRWVLHHSAISAEHGDGMVIGASSRSQLESTIRACKAGPLPEHVVKAVDAVWEPAKATAPDYSPVAR